MFIRMGGIYARFPISVGEPKEALGEGEALLFSSFLREDEVYGENPEYRLEVYRAWYEKEKKTYGHVARRLENEDASRRWHSQGGRPSDYKEYQQMLERLRVENTERLHWLMVTEAEIESINLEGAELREWQDVYYAKMREERENVRIAAAVRAREESIKREEDRKRKRCEEHIERCIKKWGYA